MAAEHGHSLGSITAALLRLLDQYGAQALQAAIVDAIARKVPHPNAVRLALERARHAHQTPPPVDTPLSERARSLDVTVQAHGLDGYDALRPRTEPPSEPSSDPTHPKDEP